MGSGLRGGTVGISLALHPSTCLPGIGRLLMSSPASTRASMLLCSSLLLGSALKILMSSSSLVSLNSAPLSPQQGLRAGSGNIGLGLGLRSRLGPILPETHLDPHTCLGPS